MNPLDAGSRRRAILPWDDRRLWSLLDVLRIYADKFMSVMNSLTGMRSALDRYPPGTKGHVVLDQTPAMGGELRHLVEIFTELEMPASRRIAAELLEMYEKQQQRSLSDTSMLVSLLYSSAHAEFEGRLMLGVSPSVAQFYEPKIPLFGASFANRFNQYDLEEAAKCLALGRATACAFHLMRVVETGLRAVHTCLGISVALVGNDRNWGTILQRIRTDLKGRPKDWAERATFDEIYALLDSVKGRWRDPTMHVEEKYTEEEARRLFQTVHNFMERLADRMDESGLPLA